jgi:Derlin-2/3
LEPSTARMLTLNRTIVAAMAIESILVHSGLVSGFYVIFMTDFIFKFPLPELWRILTAFLLTGGGFSFVFDLYFSRLRQSML